HFARGDQSDGVRRRAGRPHAAGGLQAWRRIAIDTRRIQPAHLLSAKPRPRPDARFDFELGVGLRLVPAHAHRGRPRAEATPQTGAGSWNSAALSDRAWRRLSLLALGNSSMTRTVLVVE